MYTESPFENEPDYIKTPQDALQDENGRDNSPLFTPRSSPRIVTSIPRSTPVYSADGNMDLNESSSDEHEGLASPVVVPVASDIESPPLNSSQTLATQNSQHTLTQSSLSQTPFRSLYAKRISNYSEGGPTIHKRKRKPLRPKKRVVNPLREIQLCQKSTKLLIPRAPFYRMIKEIIRDVKSGVRVQKLAAEALHEACESFLVQFFEDVNHVSIHAHRVTIMPRDVHLARRLRRMQ